MVGTELGLASGQLVPKDGHGTVPALGLPDSRLPDEQTNGHREFEAEEQRLTESETVGVWPLVDYPLGGVSLPVALGWRTSSRKRYPKKGSIPGKTSFCGPVPDVERFGPAALYLVCTPLNLSLNPHFATPHSS